MPLVAPTNTPTVGFVAVETARSSWADWALRFKMAERDGMVYTIVLLLFAFGFTLEVEN